MTPEKKAIIDEVVKDCPWISFTGDAGTKEYASQVRLWFAEEFPDAQWQLSCNEQGWWHVEEIVRENS